MGQRARKRLGAEEAADGGPVLAKDDTARSDVARIET